MNPATLCAPELSNTKPNKTSDIYERPCEPKRTRRPQGTPDGTQSNTNETGDPFVRLSEPTLTRMDPATTSRARVNPNDLE